MSRLLDLVRAQQAARPQPAINAERVFQDRAVHAHVTSFSHPVGVKILAWCQEHPEAVGQFGGLVENLRQAIACKQLIADHLLAVWSEIPETIEAGYDYQGAV